jgi:hypothetical protein
MPPFDARRGAEAGFPAIPAVPIEIGFHHPPQLSVIDRFFGFGCSNHSGINTGETAR